MNELESIPLTVGLTIGLVVILSAVVGFVWTIATIRSNDKDAINSDIAKAAAQSMNAIDRLESKTDGNHEQLHARVNDLIEKNSDIIKEVYYQRGLIDSMREKK